MNTNNSTTNQDVDLDAGNSFSAFAHKVNQSSYHNSPFVVVRESEIGGFRSSKGFKLQNLPADLWLTGGMDGIGTKVLISDAADLYHLSPADLMAMTCGDITRKGGLPLIFMNVLNVASLEGENNIRARRLMQGLGSIAKEQRIVLFNGETAELKGLSIADSDPNLSYLWESAVVGVINEKTEITGASIRPGQVIVAFEDKSPGSNGITELRRGLSDFYSNHGFLWWNNSKAKDDIKAAAMPCTLYDNFLNYINGWYDKKGNPSKTFEPVIKIHGIAHISGGGIPDKLAGDLLFSQGYGALLRDLFSPPEIFEKVGKVRRKAFPDMSDTDYLKRVYNNWHGGQRLLAIVDQKDVSLLLSEAKDYGLVTRIAGEVIGQPVLTIRSKYEFDGNFGHSVNYKPEDLVRE